MKLEEKNLLLKDLCARLPYNPLADVAYLNGAKCKNAIVNTPLIRDFICEDLVYVKPYLRQMESLTEEEKRDAAVLFLGGVPYKDKKGEWHTIVHDPSYGEIHTDFDLYYFANGYYGFENIDFLYSHHIDFRGLIPKGLALEAPEGMYN